MLFFNNLISLWTFSTLAPIIVFLQSVPATANDANCMQAIAKQPQTLPPAHPHTYSAHTLIPITSHRSTLSTNQLKIPYTILLFSAAAANDVFFVALLPIFSTDCSCHLSPFDKTPWHNEESTLSQRRFGQTHLQYRTTLPAVCIVPAALDVPMPHPGVTWILNHKPRSSPFPMPVPAFLHTVRSDGSLAFSMMWHKWQCA